VLCKICYKNETDSSSGICWECCSIGWRYLVFKQKETTKKPKIKNKKGKKNN
jgi:hypothetical protein